MRAAKSLDDPDGAVAMNAAGALSAMKEPAESLAPARRPRADPRPASHHAQRLGGAPAAHMLSMGADPEVKDVHGDNLFDRAKHACPVEVMKAMGG